MPDPIRLFAIVRARIRTLFRRDRQEAELDRELRFHFAQAIAEHRAAGMSETEARAAARAAFGGVAQYQEEVRDAWRVRFLDDLARDIRYAWRGLLRQPVLVAVAALSVGLGVGVNLAIFALADELALARPSARDAEQLVAIHTMRGSHVGYREWAELAKSGAVAGVAGYQIEREVNWRGPDATVSLVPLLVTANFFDLVGVPLARGRGFGAAEAEASRDPALVVVSHRFWTNQLGSDSAVVGRALEINGRIYTITGVLAPAIRSLPGFGISPELYLPLGRALLPDLDDESAPIVQLVGRLRPGQTIAAATSSLDRFAARSGAGTSDSMYRRLQDVTPITGLGQLGGIGPAGAFFVLLSVVVGLILVIACANVTGLLLARNGVRRREFAARLSLGASRGRLVRQLVTEGVWLAIVGAVVGLLVALPLFRLLNGLALPLPIPIELHLALNPRLLAFSLLLVGGATVLSSLAPALDASNTRPSPGLHLEPRGPGDRRLRARRLLVMAQVAVSLVLLVTALLFVKNLLRTRTIDPGFEVEHGLVVEIGFPPAPESPDVRADRLDDALNRVRALPGIRAAAIADGVPLTIRSGSTNMSPLAIAGGTPVAGSWENLDVGPGYFAALHIPLLAGRDFISTDRKGAPTVVVVNREFVRRFLGTRAAVGTRVRISAGDPVEIVGVVGDIKHRTLGEAPRAAIFHALRQRGEEQRLIYLMVDAAKDPGQVQAAVGHAVGGLGPSVAVSVEPTSAALQFALLPSRIGATLLGSLGGVALLLALAGLYSVISYSVSRRVVEIGIRMALGARSSTVERLILRDGIAVVGAGLLAGLAISWLVTRPLATFLVAGLSATDPAVFLSAAVTLLGLGIAATWVPAHRAAGIQPLVALRSD